MKLSELGPAGEAEALKETENAFRELVQYATQAGIPKVQIAMMLRSIATELQPPLVIEHVTVQ